MSKFWLWSKTGFYLVKWDFGGPKLAKMGQKDEKQWFFEKVVTYI